jgi:sirohydrochlorin cobaltochelatase
VRKTTTQEGVLLAAVGTSDRDARGALARIVDGVKRAFPGADVRLAITSDAVRRAVLREEGIVVDPPSVALAKMRDDGISAMTVQPLTVIAGEEYDRIASVVGALRDAWGAHAFSSLHLGAPLLETREDSETIATLLRKEYGGHTGDGGVVVFVGHGSRASAASTYARLQLAFDDEGLPFVIGTLLGRPGLDAVKLRLVTMNPSKVTLAPFMIVAGGHAKNDMAAPDDPGSWLSVLSKEGYSVNAILKGLGDVDGIPELFASHIAEAAREA